VDGVSRARSSPIADEELALAPRDGPEVEAARRSEERAAVGRGSERSTDLGVEGDDGSRVHERRVGDDGGAALAVDGDGRRAAPELRLREEPPTLVGRARIDALDPSVDFGCVVEVAGVGQIERAVPFDDDVERISSTERDRALERARRDVDDGERRGTARPNSRTDPAPR